MFAIVFQQVFIMFLLMLIGFVYAKTTGMQKAECNRICNILLMIVTPCLLLSNLQRPFQQEIVKELLFSLGLAVVSSLDVYKRQRPDKAFFKIRMDFACGLRRFGAFFDRPGAHFLLAGCQIGNEPQQLVTLLNQAVQTGGFQPQLVEEKLFVLFGHIGNILFNFGADGQYQRAFRRSDFADLPVKGVFF